MLTDSSWTRHWPIGFASYVRLRLDDEERMFSQLPESQPARHPPPVRHCRQLTGTRDDALGGCTLTAVAHTAPVRMAETIPFYIPVHHPEQTVHSVMQPHTGPSVPESRSPSSIRSRCPCPRRLLFPRARISGLIPTVGPNRRTSRTWRGQQRIEGDGQPAVRGRRGGPRRRTKAWRTHARVSARPPGRRHRRHRGRGVRRRLSRVRG